MVMRDGANHRRTVDGRAHLNPSTSFDRPVISDRFGRPSFVPFAGVQYRLKDILQ
ncbi:hypothetical protein [Burkholderia cepacia]|uniref:hypothetical protein n=1 Tax=Burkholderia cepacia TaxID=292 RepID=UPI00158D0BB0|nr:hypothetical protein [Burkholderia cepacia]